MYNHKTNIRLFTLSCRWGNEDPWAWYKLNRSARKRMQIQKIVHRIELYLKTLDSFCHFKQKLRAGFSLALFRVVIKYIINFFYVFG